MRASSGLVVIAVAVLLLLSYGLSAVSAGGGGGGKGDKPQPTDNAAAAGSQPEAAAATDGTVGSESLAPIDDSVCGGDHFCELLGYCTLAAVFLMVGWCFYRVCAGDPASLMERFELRTDEYKQVTAAAKRLPGNAEWITTPPADATVLYAFPRPGLNEWTGWYAATESNAEHAGMAGAGITTTVNANANESQADGASSAAASVAASKVRATPLLLGARMPLRMHLNFNGAPAPVINSNGNITTRPATLSGNGTELDRVTDVSTGTCRIPGKFVVDGLWSGATGRVSFSKVHGKGERQVCYFFRGCWDGTVLKGEWSLIQVAANMLERGRFELRAPDSVLAALANAPKLVYSTHSTHLAANADPWQVAPLHRSASTRVKAVPAPTPMQLYPQLHTYQAGGIPPGAVHAIAIPMTVHTPPPAASSSTSAAAAGAGSAGGGTYGSVSVSVSSDRR